LRHSNSNTLSDSTEFLFPRAQGDLQVSAKSVAKVLRLHVNNAVAHDGGTLILKRGEDAHTKIAWFEVRRAGMA